MEARTRSEVREVLLYFAATFAISWGAIALAFGVGPLTPAQLETRGAILYVALLAGPSLAGLGMLGLFAGRAGFRELRARLLAWRVRPRWYAFAILAAPVSLSLVLLGLRSFPGLVPDVFVAEGLGARLPVGIGAGLAVGLCEELGWTGFAVPRMRARMGVVTTGAVLGLVWGAWHFPPFWEANSFSDPVALAFLLARLFSWLPPFRVLMVWLHDRTHSLLLVVLMHTSLVATQLVLVAPFTFEPTGALVYILVWAAVLWAFGAIMGRRA